MKRGIYILVNDRFIDYTIALVNSIRCYDKEVDIIAIPYDRRYKKVLSAMSGDKHFSLYHDILGVEAFVREAGKIFRKTSIRRIDQFRKQACWFGPLDEFLYIDTDIVVFKKIAALLDYLADSDFISCDFQFKDGKRFLFTEKIVSDGILCEEDLNYVFNAGFWGGRKGALTKDAMFCTFEWCADHREYFDFTEGVSDMPVFNYMVLKDIKKKCNIVTQSDRKEISGWAGMDHFVEKDHKLIDPANGNVTLNYIHWAGIKINPGCPYWDLWEYYRGL